ncbi:hypothetical protein V5799_009058 [Amblyomma americanum]|uniref:Uncharacterized protein n=1 Tax=Amblyomma americanum TaxID=6943 RepID=A0AAQ4FBE5_AMBAM
MPSAASRNGGRDAADIGEHDPVFLHRSSARDDQVVTWKAITVAICTALQLTIREEGKEVRRRERPVG